jgi:hypothetical protein
MRIHGFPFKHPLLYESMFLLGGIVVMAILWAL